MIDLAQVKAALAARLLDVCFFLFPRGQKSGGQFHIGNIAGEPGKSLSVVIEGAKAGTWCDFAEGAKGGPLDLWMQARNLSFRDALREAAQWAGIADTATAPRHAFASTPKPALIGTTLHADSPLRTKHNAGPVHEPTLPTLPNLERGSREDLLCLSTSRSLARAALSLATERGSLWFFDSSEGRAWLITDRAGRNAQARRLDGQPWAWNGKKAWTLGGSCASWPIGLPESAPFPAVALCEGGPDFISAFHHALASGVEENLAPVCMVGASLSILAECLPAFSGKRVRIFVHDDDEGLRAARRWAAQLRGIVEQVDGFTFDGLTRTDGAPVADLCDLAAIGADSWELNHDVVENCMAFAMNGRAA